jgi:hypothetical protein
MKIKVCPHHCSLKGRPSGFALAINSSREEYFPQRDRLQPGGRTPHELLSGALFSAVAGLTGLHCSSELAAENCTG